MPPRPSKPQLLAIRRKREALASETDAAIAQAIQQFQQTARRPDTQGIEPVGRTVIGQAGQRYSAHTHTHNQDRGSS